MKIDVSNTSLAAFLQINSAFRGNAARNLPNPRASEALGVAVSISGEARAILDELDILADKLGNLALPSKDPDSDAGRLNSAFRDGGIKGLAAELAKIREELEARYEGLELDEQLLRLDSDFLTALEHIARSADGNLRLASVEEAECEILNDFLRMADNVEELSDSMRELIIRLSEMIRRLLNDNEDFGNLRRG
jgi:hypothetical protein